MDAILGADRPEQTPNRLTRAIKSWKALKKKPLQKPKKNIGFLMFLESRGLRREPLEIQEGSEEAPTELQKPKRKDAEIAPKKCQILTAF